ncbi:MAG: hypothetical protein H7Y32_18860 [Chloroflexales bacterium]|nr:hypothetical protein [Chloroflexales bacterium]
MQRVSLRPSPLARRGALLLIVLCVLPAGVAFAATAPLARTPLRLAAQARWSARPFENYRITVRVESQNRACFQEVEIRGARNAITRDSCRTFWLSALSVARLFDLSSRLERPPECSPVVQSCACQRLRIGAASFDERLGFPTQVSLQRWVRPNPGHFDFWRQLFEKRALPACGASGALVRLTVVALTPIV